jgi:hypothetical protein
MVYALISSSLLAIYRSHLGLPLSPSENIDLPANDLLAGNLPTDL